MFIYKGRIYKYARHANGKNDCVYCDLCIANNKDASLAECWKRCIGAKLCREIFISRLFHVILEVFYEREIREVGK